MSYSDDLETGTVTSQPWDKKSSIALISPIRPRVSVLDTDWCTKKIGGVGHLGIVWFVCFGLSHYRPLFLEVRGGVLAGSDIQESICATMYVIVTYSTPDPVRLAHPPPNDISDLDIVPLPL